MQDNRLSQQRAVFPQREEIEFVSVCVRDPRLHKVDPWHTHVDYEICLQTNSMCFRKNTSYVRRRYSDFVWLRHCLKGNALIIELPKLPPWNPFFSLKNKEQVSKRMKGLQEFLENVFQNPLLLSDSRLHLFLQSELSIRRIERCALGKTRFTVAEAIQQSRSSYSSSEDKSSSDSDCESSASSDLGLSIDAMARDSPVPFHHSN
uniref:Sorting nexin 10a n=1 Tax=Xiphophorus couchianus TaxID=32473 RepID=A0A3B5L1I3_9TELE